MKVLVLDDDPERIRWFREQYNAPTDIVDWVQTVEAAINYLSVGRYHKVYLDHDLGTEPAVGRDVAKWMIRTKFSNDTPIRVHSVNAVSGPKITRELRDAGYDAYWLPFPPGES